MHKFGSTILEILRMLHILLVVLFLGGIVSSLVLTMSLNLSNFDELYFTYKRFNFIADRVVQIGAEGTILLGIVNVM